MGGAACIPPVYWGRDMATTTYRIELKVDIDASLTDRHEVIREACKRQAAVLLATAVLVSDNRKPQIAVFAEDFFDGTSEISIYDENGELLA